MSSFADFFKHIGSLPAKTKNLLALGLTLGLIVALPLFLLALKQNFENRGRTSQDFQTIVFDDNFNGTTIDATSWEIVGSGLSIDNGTLKVDIAGGSTDTNAGVSTKAVLPGDFKADLEIKKLDANQKKYSFAEFIAKKTDDSQMTWISVRRDNNGKYKVLSNSVGEGSPKESGIDNPPFVLRIKREGKDIETFYKDGNDFKKLATFNNALEGDVKIELRGWSASPEFPTLEIKFEQFHLEYQVPSASPTPTASPSPSASPTASPTTSASPSGSPTASPTASPSPTPTGSAPPGQSMEFRVKFAGVTDEKADGAKIKVRFFNGTFDVETSPITVSYVAGGVYKAEITLASLVPPGAGYNLYVKGEKHVARKFCQDTGQVARCTGLGNINVPPAGDPIKVYDFTGLALEPGDLPIQDGKADGSDFAKIEARMAILCADLTAADKLTADLDYSGCVNTTDAFLMRKTLETKYDDD